MVLAVSIGGNETKLCFECAHTFSPYAHMRYLEMKPEMPVDLL
jgi:hypothetical protein